MTALTTQGLSSLLADLNQQPNWRAEASRCVQYYDGNQLTDEMIRVLKARGQPVLVNNLIGPVVDGILGMEAKTRQGFLVRADNDEFAEGAEALNEEVNEFARVTNVDRARGDAFGSQVKAGLGWVEVTPNSDPFEYPYLVTNVHRNEMWWDWHSVSPDLSDARWLMRRRWLDEDEAIAFFPQHKDVVKHAAAGWVDFAEQADLDLMSRPQLHQAYNDYADFNWHDDQLFDTDRRRVRVHEVYYRVFERGLVMVAPGGKTARFEKENQFHRALVTSGQVEVKNMPYKRMYLAWYVGPHRVWSGPSPLPHNIFPYVPFWGLREDETNVPYGLIRRMISPQDEVNFRRSKLTYLLNNKRVIKDEDAVKMSDADLLDELGQSDAIITLNKNRQNKESKGFWVETETGIASQQFQIMQEAKQQIQDCAGVYSAMLGQDSSATSGIAINGLIEQGATTLAEIFDNYRFGSKQVGELMLSYKISEIGNRPRQVLVNVNKPEPTKKVMLNQPIVDDQGRETVNNDVTRMKAMIVLDDIVNTPGYRAQVTQRMMELVQTLPPNLQAAVVDLVIMNTDVPNKEEFLKRIRRATGQGVNPEDLSEEERQQFEQQQQAQAMQQQMAMQEMQTRIAGLEAEARRKLAAAQKDEAAAESMGVKDDLTEAQTLKVLGELKQLSQQIQSAAINQAGYIHPQQQIEPRRTLMA